MEERILTNILIGRFKEHLVLEERSGATVEKYLRDTKTFLRFTGYAVITKETMIAYKNKLKNSYARRQTGQPDKYMERYERAVCRSGR